MICFGIRLGRAHHAPRIEGAVIDWTKKGAESEFVFCFENVLIGNIEGVVKKELRYIKLDDFVTALNNIVADPSEKEITIAFDFGQLKITQEDIKGIKCLSTSIGSTEFTTGGIAEMKELRKAVEIGLTAIIVMRDGIADKII